MTDQLELVESVERLAPGVFARGDRPRQDALRQRGPLLRLRL